MKDKVTIIWSGFKRNPVGRTVRMLSPQWLINLLEHYPLAVLANVVHFFPSRKMVVVGVTGTDGKTTTVNMVYRILKDAGKKVSMISTINAHIGDREYETGFHVTSPHPFTVQQLLKQAMRAGTEVMVLEVTSNALDQYRFWGIRFDIGVITNITHDHLDYHKTWENYFQAKASLIKNVSIAVLNHDEEHFIRLSKVTKGKVVSFGSHKNASFNPLKFPLKLKIPGEFNVLNGLAAAAVGINLGVSSKEIRKTLENFSGLVGRMEEVENESGKKIFIDFAHTPNALENALKTLKKMGKGRVIAVFGAASQRDILKRPLMGEVASKLADVVVLTDEDPRFEDSDKIIDQIAKGCYESGGKDNVSLFKEPDRERAIALALKLAEKGDVVGIFGKGHERSMNYKGVERVWSDREAVNRVLEGQL